MHGAVDAEQHRGPGDALAMERGDHADVGRGAAEPPAPAGVDGQFHLLVGLAAAVAGGGEAGALEGEEAVACHLDQLGDGSLDPLAAVDGDGDERQVLGEREQAIRLQSLPGAEALGAAQEDAARQLAPLEQVEHGPERKRPRWRSCSPK